ncbi:MAG: DsbA family protein [Actinomycetota bacterium]|nr:DsbA family protein [Actinomycetota bacterium]
MALSFAVTWDYRCPFARIAHDHLVTALTAGADWDVTFRAFSLDQGHVEEGQTPVWDDPGLYPGLLANEAGIVVRERQPEQFLTVHEALFSARHDRSLDTRKREVITEVLDGAGVDGGQVMAEIDDGWPLETFRKEHTTAVDELDVFGVPTFISGDRAAFVRLLERPHGDAEVARATVERIVALLTGWPQLNEYKHTRIDR